MQVENYRIYTSFNNVGNPDRLTRAFKYFHIVQKYNYILKNNWTGYGFRQSKLKSIIKKAEKLANYNAAKFAGKGNLYCMYRGKIEQRRVYFLTVQKE